MKPPSVAGPQPSRYGKAIGITVAAVLGPVFALAIVASVLASAMGWKASSLPSASMQPGLVVGDMFFIDTRAYTNGRLPARGDIVPHYVPPGQAQARDNDGKRVEYLKRIVGLPNETITMSKGIPAVNGIPFTQRFAALDPPRWRGGEQPRRVREEMPRGQSYELLYYSSNSLYRDGGPFVVPDGFYFVLGDNRDDSLDSRTGKPNGWYVPIADIIGRANFIYWSSFERLDRIGMAVK